VNVTQGIMNDGTIV